MFQMILPITSVMWSKMRMLLEAMTGNLGIILLIIIVITIFIVTTFTKTGRAVGRSIAHFPFVLMSLLLLISLIIELTS